MLNRRNEPIPERTISLTAAFQKFIQDRFPSLGNLESLAEHSLRTVRQTDVLDPATRELVNEYDDMVRKAELSFREWLSANGPVAYVLDPATREIRRIDSSEWIAGSNFIPGIHDDFVSPDDSLSHGPSDAQIDGVLQKVFFNEGEFERKLISTTGNSSKPSKKLKQLKSKVPSKGPRRAARLALDALYPEGVPVEKSGEELHRNVNRWLDKQSADLIEGRVRQAVSIDTVLRAAERK